MGSCVSKKAARAGAGAKVAAPLPPEKDNALPPPVLVVEEEEVKEVLPETAVQRPRPPEPEPEPEDEKVKRIEEHEEGEASDSVSVGSSSVVEKAMVKPGKEHEVEKRTVDPPETEKAKRRKARDQRNPNDVSSGRARSPSPATKQRRQLGGTVGEQPVAARPRREQPAVVSGIGCRSGRFSPSAARRAAESAVRRTYSAREADMALPSSTAKRSLNASIGGVRRDPGERSGRRPDSPARRTPASPAANVTMGRQPSATRKVTKENASPEQTKRQCGRGRGPGETGLGDDELDEAPIAGKEHKEAAEGALGQNPSVAMECFIFL